jgi:hypothetical protein
MVVTGMSALVVIALLLIGGIVWLVREVVKQVITQVLTNERDWWAPRLEAMLVRFAALFAPSRADRKTLRDTWLTELDLDRMSGETRVLKAVDYLRASFNLWRRLPPMDDASVVEIHAADGATMVEPSLVLDTSLLINATSEVTANLEVRNNTREPVTYRRSVMETLPAAGDRWSHNTSAGARDADINIVNFMSEYASTDNGLRADGVVRVSGSASITLPPPGLSAHGVVRVSGTAGFAPTS